jgi:2-polyprenyl-3-methyl-5-hydroxy-6-metoxy-1,4-benzoquinol methylase
MPEPKEEIAPVDYGYRSAVSGHPEVDRYLIPGVLRAMVDVPKGSTVLDLGCGNGATTSVLAKNGWDMWGVDISESGIRHAQQAHPHIRFSRWDAHQDLSFLEHSFDAVVSTEMIEHVYDPDVVVANCWQALRPRGKLILTTPYHGWLKNVVIAATDHYDAHHSALWRGGHIKFWSPATISRLLERNGFSQIEWRGVGRFPWLWKGMVVTARKDER